MGRDDSRLMGMNRLQLFLTLSAVFSALVIVVIVAVRTQYQRPPRPSEPIVMAWVYRREWLLGGRAYYEFYSAINGDRLKYDFPDGIEYDPQWSPDGQWILYRMGGASAGEQPTLFVVSSDGTQHITLDFYGERPQWSPNSGALLYEGYANGKRQVFLVEMSCILTGQGCQVTPKAVANGYDASWSPDGERIALSTELTGGVSVVNVEESESPVVISPWVEGCHWPQWSPHGQWIATTCANGQIRLYASDTSLQQDLGTSGCSRTIWSPDSNQLLSTCGDYLTVIYVSSAPQIVNLGIKGESIGWSPDKTQIAAVVTPPNNASHLLGGLETCSSILALIKADGSDLTYVTDGNNSCVFDYQWLPIMAQSQ